MGVSGCSFPSQRSKRNNYTANCSLMETFVRKSKVQFVKRRH
jgi:hypothetical protein